MFSFPVICVDNFYRDPDLIRNFALSLEYKSMPDTMLGGKRTEALHNINKDFHDDFCQKFLSIFYNFKKEYIEYDVFTYFNMMDPLDPDADRFTVPHSDDDAIAAGLIYLTPNANMDCGTKIYRANLDGTSTVTAEFKNIYNRFIMYDAMEIHGPSKVTEKRLTQVFFASKIDTNDYGIIHPLRKMRRQVKI